MKRLSAIVIALCTMVHTVWAYDFSVVVSSGQTLYFNITSDSTHTVEVTTPNELYPAYGGYAKPTGNLIIPNTVVNNATTYTVTSIRIGVFFECNNLTSVIIPNTVTAINEQTFSSCSGLTSVTIPNSVTAIHSSAFEECSSLTSITIPNSVTYIGWYAFSGCSSLTSIIIPNSVTYIGEWAFSNCTGLTSVTISDSVTSIEYGTFASCTSLASINIHDNITSFETNAFVSCFSLTSVTIPTSVTSIGELAFAGCSGLNTLNFNAVNCSDFVNEELAPFLGCPISTINIGSDVRYIPAYFAYNLDSLVSINIPDSVTAIGNAAFSNCSNLTSINIPNNLTSIGNGTFDNCSSLTTITIPSSVTSIGRLAFNNCNNLTTLNFNAINCSDFYYYYYPFNNCPISTLNISDSLRYIPAYFAYNLDSLLSITIPDSITSIGNGAFSNCDGLSSITIPNSVTSIGNSVFSGCIGLTSITISNSVTSIGNSAFSGCIGLTSITIPNSVTVIENSTFSGCSALASLTIPDNVTSIGNEAFKNCTTLTSFTIPYNVTYIGKFAFEGCVNLVTLNFNAINCENFLSPAYNYKPPFYYCPISTMNIGDTVQRIPNYFAYNLDSLVSVTIPNNVASIGENAFNNCNSLQEIISLPVLPPTLGTNVFSNSPMLKVPCGSLEYYNPDSAGWRQYFVGIDEMCNVILTVTSSNDTMGSVLGSGEYSYGAVAVLTATPNDGYQFISWNDANTDNPRMMTLVRDTAFVAIFEEIPIYTITVISANDSMGTVLGGGAYEADLQVTITATAEENYHFVSWNDGDTNNPRIITLTGDTTFIAYFALNNYTATVISANDSMGTVSGGGTYEAGSQVTITATAAEGYRFVSWNDGDTNNPRIVTLTGDTTFIANFERITDSTTGIEDVAVINARVYSSHSRIVVEGADGNNVMLFDMSGRLLATKRDEYSRLEFEVPISGAYFVKIGNYKAQKIVVIK